MTVTERDVQRDPLSGLFAIASQSSFKRGSDSSVSFCSTLQVTDVDTRRACLVLILTACMTGKETKSQHFATFGDLCRKHCHVWVCVHSVDVAACFGA